MANTYRKVYLQIVFSVKYRQALLDKSWRSELFKYIAGIINERNHISLAVNGTKDHIHVFLIYNTRELIQDLVKEIKRSSTAFINDNKLCSQKFQWQRRYGVFSYSSKEVDIIIKYIKNQEEHHRKKSFRMEYLESLEKFDIEFNEEYVFEFFDK